MAAVGALVVARLSEGLAHDPSRRGAWTLSPISSCAHPMDPAREPYDRGAPGCLRAARAGKVREPGTRNPIALPLLAYGTSLPAVHLPFAPRGLATFPLAVAGASPRLGLAALAFASAPLIVNRPRAPHRPGFGALSLVAVASSSGPPLPRMRPPRRRRRGPRLRLALGTKYTVWVSLPSGPRGPGVLPLGRSRRPDRSAAAVLSLPGARPGRLLSARTHPLEGNPVYPCASGAGFTLKTGTAAETMSVLGAGWAFLSRGIADVPFPRPRHFDSALLAVSFPSPSRARAGRPRPPPCRGPFAHPRRRRLLLTLAALPSSVRCGPGRPASPAPPGPAGRARRARVDTWDACGAPLRGRWPRALAS